MNQKYILKIIIFILCVTMLLFVSKSFLTLKKSTENLPISSNYDVHLYDDTIGQNTTAPVDYYLLALSWSPGFCEQQRKHNGNHLPTSVQYQCATNQHFGWIIHGLWPQNASARHISEHPRFCQGDLPVVSQDIIKVYLPESPSAKLLQGEWEKHGACAFNSAQDYFEKQRKLYRTLTLPQEEISRTDLFKWMKQHNPQLANHYLEATRNELFICYDKNWKVINCPTN